MHPENYDCVHSNDCDCHNLESMMRQVVKDAQRGILDELHHELDADLLGVDAKWLLFGMAVQSYRYESLLLPYPPAFCTPTGYNIDALHLAMGTMPDFNRVHRKLFDDVLSVEQLDLMYWLLVESGTPRLHHLMRNEQLLLWRELGQRPLMRPQLVFRVDAGNMPSNAEPLDGCACIFYCGGMEELYRLIATPQRDALSSELEFFDELEVACENAEWSPGWGYSLCGALLRCVAICEMRQESVGPGQLLYVRYLLFYSMNYSQKMQRLRRSQWKLIEKKKLQKQMQQQQNAQNADEQQLLESDQENVVEQASAPTSRGGSILHWLSNKLVLYVVLGVLKLAGYRLRS